MLVEVAWAAATATPTLVRLAGLSAAADTAATPVAAQLAAIAAASAAVAMVIRNLSPSMASWHLVKSWHSLFLWIE